MKKKLRCGFSHEYTKLYGQTAGRLLEVKRLRRNDIDEVALLYDTRFETTNAYGQTVVTYFNLDRIYKYLRMTFIGNKGIPFTTYRTDTPEHREKYEGNVGKEFEIYVNEG